MAAVLLTITLTFTTHEQPRFVNMDLNANITFETESLNRCGTSWIPHVTTIHPACPNPEYLIRHELQHHDQWTALGPAFPLSYALTGGRAFEDYLDGGWAPPKGLEGSCPLVRVSEGVEFMPCYRL